MTSTAHESAVKANSSEAQRLYERGLAAARGGQKRVAAGLLTRSVQLDPRNERAWLWLSGVLEEPQQQAFCLHAVLKLNPANQHAQRGLRLLEERKLLNGAPQAAPGLSIPSDEIAISESEGAAKPHGDSWWVHWRRSRHEMSRARLLLWSFPLILICLAIVLYESFALAVARSQPMPTATADLAFDVTTAAPPPTIEAILEAEPISVVEGRTVAYLGALDPLRAGLREATKAYRTATSQPIGSVGYVAATQRLRVVVEQSLADLDKLRPPGTLQQAHDDYRKGLDLELEGLDAILEFYSGYDVANANRAALRFQEARAYIERASNSFASQAQQLAQLSSISAHTAR